MMETASSEMPAIAVQLEQVYLENLRKLHWWSGRSSTAPYIPERLDRILPQASESRTFASIVRSWLPVPSLLIIICLLFVFFGWQPAVLFTLAVGYFVFHWLSNRRVLRLMRERLESSDILIRLVDGDPQIRSIVDNTPLPWRYIFIGYMPNNLRGNALLVAYNLDWYLGPQGLHFRWIWIDQLVWPTMLVAITLWLGYNIFHPFLLVFVFYVAIISENIDGFHRQTIQKALVQQLRHRFGGIEPGES